MMKKFLAGAAVGALFLSAHQAHAFSYQHAGILSPDGNEDISSTFPMDSYYGGFSSDGSAIVGYTNNTSAAFLYQDDTTTDLGILSGGTSSFAYGVSADGGVVVGYSDIAGGYQHAFRWTGGTMTDLGTLNGTNAYSNAYGVSGDGSVVVGYSDIGGGYQHAFRWVGGTMTDLGTLIGTNANSYGTAVSADGTTVVGRSDVAGSTSHAFRWVGGTMTDLGSLNGAPGYSDSIAVSTDGKIVAGTSDTSAGYSHAYRWTEAGGTMVDLGSLNGTNASSYAYGMSADGKTVVGMSDTSGGQSAFIWTEASGTMEDLNDVAADAGINMSGIALDAAFGVSATSATIIAHDSSNQAIYILKLSEEGSGIITPDELAASLQPARAVSQQGSSAVQQGLGRSMFTARYALSSFASAPAMASAATGISAGSAYAAPQRRAAYATGTFGLGQYGNNDNSAYNGSAGMLFRVSDVLALGGGVIGGGSTVKTHLGGHSELESLGGAMLASYQGDSGFRAYGVAAVAYLYVDSTRHYMNGSSVDTSAGTTNGLGYGTSLHTGWAYAASSRTTFEPYVELEYAQINLQGYTEQGGGFAASYSDNDTHRFAARLGGSIDHAITKDTSMGVHAAWGHRLSGNGGSFTASSSGFTLPMSGNIGDRNWAEGGISGSFRLSPVTTLSADLTGRTGKTEASRLEATVGLSYAF